MRSCETQLLLLENTKSHYILGIGLPMPIPDFLNDRQAFCGKLKSGASTEPRIDLAQQAECLGAYLGQNRGHRARKQEGQPPTAIAIIPAHPPKSTERADESQTRFALLRK